MKKIEKTSKAVGSSFKDFINKNKDILGGFTKKDKQSFKQIFKSVHDKRVNNNKNGDK